MVRWLSANWIWVIVIGGMLWMHLGMHRGHGGHGGHGRHGGGSPGTSEPQQRPAAVGHADSDRSPHEDEQAGGHRHRGC